MAERWLRRGGWLAGSGCVATVLCATPQASASASFKGAPKRQTAQRAATPWEQAERARDDFESIPEPDRTRAQYTRVMDAYRAIYHEHPDDMHAAAAIYAVAELLDEQGRTLHDPAAQKAAIGQYEFLRKQYPGSGLRVQALLAEGEIQESELKDSAAARERYALLLRIHPRSPQAEEARAGLESLEQPRPALGAAVQIRPAATSATQAQNRAGPGTDPVAKLAQVDAETRPQANPTGPTRIGKKAVVTGIRHWSTSSYTRVAIDLGDSVTYEAARVPNPDRIYFDLHGTRLAQDLVGKSFSVTDDGFLKRIRAAQFSDDMTRVVLDVNDVTEYSAFLLPNPYRLIIDIHGRQQSPALNAQSPGEPANTPQPATVSTPETPAPHTPGIVRSTEAKPVPNTLATRQASPEEVAAVSGLPGRVQATSRPTSQPISAVVAQDSATKQEATTAPAKHRPEIGAERATAVDGVSIAEAPATASVPVASNRHTRKSRTNAGPAVTRPESAAALPARAALPTADGETSLVRALGLKIGRIVIDAGHGGHDSGTIGVDGLEEKDVVLDIALRVGKLLHDRLGAEIIYTRSDDTFIPLETRTAIANKAQADLFLSIHANSSSDPSARGVETYYLNFTSDPSAIETAARENATSDQSIHQLSDLVKKIALKEKIEESREFASDVESSLYSGLARGNDGLKNRGVKKAPFVVLIGANMPSILAEISFVTNPRDAEELRSPKYRERVAESLYRGVARYEAGLSGTPVAVERAAAGQ